LVEDAAFAVEITTALHLRHLITPPEVVHLHWPEKVYTRGEAGLRGLFLTLLGAIRLAAGLTLIRLRGRRLVWTVHNRGPHESRYPVLDRAVQSYVGCIASGLIAHSAFAKRTFTARRQRLVNRTVVIPHGNFIGAYPHSAITRGEMRRRLGIPQQSFVFLAFGHIRAYKRLESLLSAFGESTDERYRLVVAGEAPDIALRDSLVKQASSDERILLVLEPISDYDVVPLYRAADVAVLAQAEIFTSGALILALSLGVPVIAPADGSATAIAAPPAIVTWGSGTSLGQVIDTAADTLGSAEAREAALAAVRPYSWARVAREHRERAYRPASAKSRSE
jgi:glycosyltransferase involved in cell wall biosynthesis